MQLPVFYCLVILKKNLSLRQPRELLHCLGKKKNHLIFHNKYHKCSTFYHCIIHQGTFCSKLSHLSPMLAVLTQKDEFICRNMLFLHRDFHILLQEHDATLSDGSLQDCVTCLRKNGELKKSSGWG